MPLTYDSDDLDEVERTQGGGGLRKLLEEALSENTKLSKDLGSLTADKAIEVHDWDLVKPEDLAGVAVDEIEAKGKELQGERLEAQKVIVTGMFVKQGLEGAELETKVNEFLDPPQTDDDKRNTARLASKTATGPPGFDPSDLHGTAAIEAGLRK
jgi:hypothetical protein